MNCKSILDSISSTKIMSTIEAEFAWYCRPINPASVKIPSRTSTTVQCDEIKKNWRTPHIRGMHTSSYMLFSGTETNVAVYLDQRQFAPEIPVLSNAQ